MRPAASNPLAAVRRLLHEGRGAQALRLALQWTQQQPRDAQAWTTLSELRRQAGAAAASAQAAGRAAALLPGDFAAQVRWARALLASAQRAEALAAAHAAAALAQDAAAHNTVGVLFSELEQHALALRHLGRAQALQPRDAGIAYNLATVQRFAGRIAEAIATCEQVLAVAPAHSAAYALRAELGRISADDNRIDAMEALIAQGALAWSDERNLRFALARECEELQQFSRAFEHCRRGNALQRAQLRYDVAADIAVIDALIAAHTRTALDMLAPGAPSEAPIFIVGLPRTGSTLVERVLGSHSDVFPAGERKEFTWAMSQVAARNGQRPGADPAHAALALPPAQLGEAYLQLMQPQTAGRARFVDKRPLNYLYCGLIAAALPQARIILVERAPMDACYAIFKTLFGGAYPFAYDLDDLGRYYIAYRRLVEHWASVLGDRLLRVRYEDVVEDLEGQARRLLNHCGLRWQDACRRFHENASVSTTASAVQVRRPLYASSIGKWRHYEQQLAPLRRRLENAGIVVD